MWIRHSRAEDATARNEANIALHLDLLMEFFCALGSAITLVVRVAVLIPFSFRDTVRLEGYPSACKKENGITQALMQ